MALNVDGDSDEAISRDANVGFIHILLRRSLEALSLETGG